MKITIRGLDRLNRRLDDIERDIRPTLRDATEKAVLYVHGQVPEYPSPPPRSTYRRTGTLGREIGTEVKELGSEIVGVIGTATVYAPWVISDRAVGSRGPQAGVHRGRWYTLQGVVKKARNAIIEIYQKAIHDLVN